MGCRRQPEFMLHTGDISHLARPEEFDTVDQILKRRSGEGRVFRAGRARRDRRRREAIPAIVTGKERKGEGWYSFDKKGVHFIGLVNVVNLKAGGLGKLGGSNWSGWKPT